MRHFKLSAVKNALSRRLHIIATLIGAALASVVLVSFALGEIKVGASGRGVEFERIGLGQERAKDVACWDPAGLGNVGWDTARMMNRAIGEYSGLGNNFATGWVMVLACGCVAIGAGSLGYCLTVVTGWTLLKILAQQASSSNGG